MPSPRWLETAKVGLSRWPAAARSAATSAVTAATRAGVTRSILVTTAVISATPISSKMSRCSIVCGRGPSSAATTRSTRSIDSTPASILGRKRSCPGTSTKPISLPSGSAAWAKPRSIVMPRRFSSGRRSASIPVSARISAVLPWSIWPAVARIMAALRRLCRVVRQTPPRPRGSADRAARRLPRSGR